MFFKRYQDKTPKKPNEIIDKRNTQNNKYGRPNIMPKFIEQGYSEQHIITGFTSLGFTQREAVAIMETMIKGIEFKDVITNYKLTENEINNIKIKEQQLFNLYPSETLNKYIDIFK